MSMGNDEITRLREAFASGAAAPPAADCPSSEQIGAASRGELPPKEVREVIDHTSACPSCAEDWRLAVTFEKVSTEEETRVGEARVEEARAREASHQVLRQRHRIRQLRPWLAAAAAVVGVALGLRWADQRIPFDRGEEPTLAYRGAVPTEIQSPIAGTSLPREAFRLSWSGPEGVSYDLKVRTSDLRSIVREQGLEVTEYLVPERALADFPPGTKLYWQLEAVWPDGRRERSELFVVYLEQVEARPPGKQ